MTNYFLKKITIFLKENKISGSKNKIIIFGGTFKENCPDQRNSKNIELALGLESLKYAVTIIDPYIYKIETDQHNKIKILNKFSIKYLNNNFDAAIFAVPHDILITEEINKKISIPTFVIRKF